MGLVNNIGNYPAVSVPDGGIFSRHSEVAGDGDHGKAPVVLPRIENIMNLHDSLVTARSAVEERGESVEVPESDLQRILEKIRALEDEVSALLEDDDGSQSIEVTTSGEQEEDEESSNANDEPVSGASVPSSADSDGAGSGETDQFGKKLANSPNAAVKAANQDSGTESEDSSDIDLESDSGNSPTNVSENNAPSKPNSEEDKGGNELEQKSSENEDSTEASEDDSSNPLPGGGLFKEKVMVETETMTSTMEEIDSTTTITTTMTTTITVRPTTEPTSAAGAAEMSAGAIQGAKFMELPESPPSGSGTNVTSTTPPVANVKAAVLSTPSERSEISATTPTIFRANFKEIGESQSTSSDDAATSLPIQGSDVITPSPETAISASNVSLSSPDLAVNARAVKQMDTAAAIDVIDTPTPLIQPAPITPPHKQFFKAVHNDDDENENITPTPTLSGFQTVTVPKKPKEAVSDA